MPFSNQKRIETLTERLSELEERVRAGTSPNARNKLIPKAEVAKESGRLWREAMRARIRADEENRLSMDDGDKPKSKSKARKKG